MISRPASIAMEARSTSAGLFSTEASNTLGKREKPGLIATTGSLGRNSPTRFMSPLVISLHLLNERLPGRACKLSRAFAFLGLTQHRSVSARKWDPASTSGRNSRFPSRAPKIHAASRELFTV